ncbi:MAG TPA: enoyl-CoA hydratase-related protein [Bacteroidales bacterium]|nr:enoyl-CoA hydratase-related protein [Bacteroidales bacterium]
MIEYNTLNILENEYTVTVWLNRPKVHNAINGEMIHELLHFFSGIACNKQIRAVILRGRGNSFCSGADLNWMKEVSSYNYDQNFLDSHTLAKCLFAINSCSKVVISAVHGAVMGGANGLVAASDIVISTASARFAMSEVSLGLLPAVISPYLVEKIGYSNARRYMLLADSFTARDAEQMGLVHFVVGENDLDAEIDKLINQILKNSPDAIRRTKNLLQGLKKMESQEAIMQFTSDEIAKARVSEEGQEGMAAFFKKVKPGWFVQKEKSIGEVN